jgi:hypothetical protein
MLSYFGVCFDKKKKEKEMRTRKIWVRERETEWENIRNYMGKST